MPQMYWNGEPIGVNYSNPDDSPIGTVISFMGTKAPQGYVICDGAVYDISAYPRLALHIRDQFGSFNFFGGDGASTFAVPDLRNHFLRGYHGEAEEQLSGDVGIKQEGTVFPYIKPGYTSIVAAGIDSGAWNDVQNPDKVGESFPYDQYNRDRYVSESVMPYTYTSRPLNTAVLYCIKAYSSGSRGEEDYSTDEIRVGTWIDGKPIYRQIVYGVAAQLNTGTNLYLNANVDQPINIIGFCVHPSVAGGKESILSKHFASTVITHTDNSSISVVTYTGAFAGSQLMVMIEYTKTTDNPIT